MIRLKYKYYEFKILEGTRSFTVRNLYNNYVNYGTINYDVDNEPIIKWCSLSNELVISYNVVKPLRNDEIIVLNKFLHKHYDKYIKNNTPTFSY